VRREASSAVPRISPPKRLKVDVGAAVDVVGTLTKYLSAAALVPAAVALGYGEPTLPFLGAGALMLGLGLALERFTGRAEYVGAREGYLIVALTWLVAGLFGMLPYLLSGEPQLSRPLDAYFEAMSGFTTTGATVLTDIDALPRSLLLWRQLSQWLGGMGIIVLALAILPRLRVGGRQLFESEAPGPEAEPLYARIRDTARRLWVLYVGLTAALAGIFVLLGATGVDPRMHPFNAVAHALTTMPTGGFSPENAGIAVFAPVTQWILILFMFVAGANFALMYRGIVRHQARVFARDEEFRFYLAFVLLVGAGMATTLSLQDVLGGEAAARHALFQTVSIMTTTGYASTDFASWPVLLAMMIVGLMFIGGSAGSTSGSVKVVRHLLLGRVLRRELDVTVHPELVQPIRLNRHSVEERTLRGISTFVLLYLGVFVLAAAVIAADSAVHGPHLSFIDALSVAATTIGNVGPALGVAGPLGSFEPFSDLSTLVMIVLMWMGRLELIPVLVLLTRSYWRR
jgi:trk system potassium uptake protein